LIEFDYTLDFDNIDYRKTPKLYIIGRGEQGVLLCEPYKSEICKHWRFRTPEIAYQSANTITAMFNGYLDVDNFVGADMCRKFLMMGWTRARRYANHRSGKKYDDNGRIKPQEPDHWTCEKAESARIFKRAYDAARTNKKYRTMVREWRGKEEDRWNPKKETLFSKP
jgi:hypothetical protein|tara:strand:+ start:987 stop:1487 length:501 start_codon:yes stop_codon:yes gene_type:complete